MAIEKLDVDLTVVLGQTRMPLHRLLRLGRGAVLALGSGVDDDVEIRANGLPVARGRVVVEGGVIAVEVTGLVRRPETTREPGATIGAPRPPTVEPFTPKGEPFPVEGRVVGQSR